MGRVAKQRKPRPPEVVAFARKGTLHAMDYEMLETLITATGSPPMMVRPAWHDLIHMILTKHEEGTLDVSLYPARMPRWRLGKLRSK